MRKGFLVALGGNALIQVGQQGTIEEQAQNIDASLSQLVGLIREGFPLMLTHGNGPQVGHMLIRMEAARGKAYDCPLDVCVAQSQGEMGYLIQQRMGNILRQEGIKRNVISMISRVVVDEYDPRMQDPTKPVGPFFSKEQAENLKAQGVHMVEDAHRGYRRMVPSPLPTRIVETEVIRQLYKDGTIVIAAGGGGIPVTIDEQGTMRGVEAVVDKDWSSSVLAVDLGVERILNVTGVEYAKLHFQSIREQNLETVSVQQAKDYLAEGHFLPGSMEPKIESAVHFLERGGHEVIITNPQNILQGLEGKTGTHILGIER